MLSQILNLIKNNKDWISKYILPILLIGLVLYNIGLWIYSLGQADIQEQFDQYKLNQEITLQQLKEEYSSREKEYQIVNDKIQKELADAQKNYEVSLAIQSASFTERLRESESRVQFYQHQAESGDVGCRDIAGTASRLDRSLTEGIRLVTELTEHIKLRDQQIQSIGKRLLNEKELTE